MKPLHLELYGFGAFAEQLQIHIIPVSYTHLRAHET